MEEFVRISVAWVMFVNASKAILGMIAVLRVITFTFYEIVNSLLWATFLISILTMY